MANTLTNIEFTVYPNPVLQSAMLSILLSKASQVKIIVMDMNGKLLRTIADKNLSAGSHQINFDRGSLIAGTYLLQIKTADKVMMKKVVIE
jgi:flagellar hook assembly protein FlgD